MSKTYKLGSVVKQTPDYAATVSITQKESVTVVEIALTGDVTFNLNTASKPVVGDRLVFKLGSDGTERDATFGTSLTAPVLAGVINKTKVQELVYDGSNFVAVAAPVQID